MTVERSYSLESTIRCLEAVLEEAVQERHADHALVP
jgi:hypothetical protein